jgi:hypothetical protein
VVLNEAVSDQIGKDQQKVLSIATGSRSVIEACALARAFAGSGGLTSSVASANSGGHTS